jgi:tellurite resistance protein TehA-like permease
MNVDFLTLIFPAFAALIGFPALLAALINVAKLVGILPDGMAPKIVLYVNLLALVGVGYLAFTGKVDLLVVIDQQLGVVATFLLMFATFVTELGLTKGMNNALRGTPIIGYNRPKDDGFFD